MGTLVRDADDTVTFHTNLNATHTAHPPVTFHPPGLHLSLPATPWRHTRHWVAGRSARRVVADAGTTHPGTSVVPAEWVSELQWPPSELPAGAGGTDGSWLVFGDATLGAEVSRLAGTGGTVTTIRPDLLTESIDEVLAGPPGITHVLYAPAVTDAGGPESAYRIFNAGRALAARLAERALSARLAERALSARPADRGLPAKLFC